MATFLLLVVGGVNWLLIGLANINVVAMILGGIPMLERAVYVLVGLSAVYELVMHKKTCIKCGAHAPSSASVPPTSSASPAGPSSM